MNVYIKWNGLERERNGTGTERKIEREHGTERRWNWNGTRTWNGTKVELERNGGGTGTERNMERNGGGTGTELKKNIIKKKDNF